MSRHSNFRGRFALLSLSCFLALFLNGFTSRPISGVAQLHHEITNRLAVLLVMEGNVKAAVKIGRMAQGRRTDKELLREIPENANLLIQALSRKKAIVEERKWREKLADFLELPPPGNVSKPSSGGTVSVGRKQFRPFVAPPAPSAVRPAASPSATQRVPNGPTAVARPGDGRERVPKRPTASRQTDHKGGAPETLPCGSRRGGVPKGPAAVAPRADPRPKTRIGEVRKELAAVPRPERSGEVAPKPPQAKAPASKPLRVAPKIAAATPPKPHIGEVPKGPTVAPRPEHIRRAAREPAQAADTGSRRKRVPSRIAAAPRFAPSAGSTLKPAQEAAPASPVAPQRSLTTLPMSAKEYLEAKRRFFTRTEAGRTTAAEMEAGRSRKAAPAEAPPSGLRIEVPETHVAARSVPPSPAPKVVSEVVARQPAPPRAQPRPRKVMMAASSPTSPVDHFPAVPPALRAPRDVSTISFDADLSEEAPARPPKKASVEPTPKPPKPKPVPPVPVPPPPAPEVSKPPARETPQPPAFQEKLPFVVAPLESNDTRRLSQPLLSKSQVLMLPVSATTPAQKVVNLTRDETHKLDKLSTLKVYLTFKEAEIADIVQLLAEKAELNYVSKDPIVGKTSIKFNNIQVGTALDIILKNNGYSYRVKDDVLWVYKKDEEPLETRIFFVQNLEAADLFYVVRNCLAQSEGSSPTSQAQSNPAGGNNSPQNAPAPSGPRPGTGQPAPQPGPRPATYHGGSGSYNQPAPSSGPSPSSRSDWGGGGGNVTVNRGPVPAGPNSESQPFPEAKP